MIEFLYNLLYLLEAHSILLFIHGSVNLRFHEIFTFCNGTTVSMLCFSPSQNKVKFVSQSLFCNKPFQSFVFKSSFIMCNFLLVKDLDSNSKGVLSLNLVCFMSTMVGK